MLLLRMAATAIALTWSAQGEAESSVERFYSGKTIQIVVGYSAGGSYDGYARLIGQFIGRHIPGTPSVVVVQLPGAGSRTAANYLFNIAPEDGTVLGTADQAMPVQQAMGDQDIKFDVGKLNWIGNPTSDNNLMAVWAASGIQTIEDAKRREVTVAATGLNTSSQYAQALNVVAGTKFKIIMGYPGASEAVLAMERGEAVGFTSPWSAWLASKPEWVRDHKITFLFQVGLKRMRQLPDVPLLTDLVSTKLDREALHMFSATASLGRPLFSGPGVPAERVAALRKAFDETMRDPDFLAAADKRRFAIDPVSGRDLQLIVQGIVNEPKSIRSRLAQITAIPQRN